jgi:hypothetical protein
MRILSGPFLRLTAEACGYLIDNKPKTEMSPDRYARELFCYALDKGKFFAIVK